MIALNSRWIPLGTAWSVCDQGFFNEKKGKSGLIEELGRATFEEEQDCRLV